MRNRTNVELVEDWNLARIEDISLVPVINGIYKEQSLYGTGVPMIHMGDVFAKNVISKFEHLQKVEISDRERRTHTTVSGDILFARRSLKPEGAGDCSLIVSDELISFESSVIRVRPNQKAIDPKYLLEYLKSSYGKAQMMTIVRVVAVSGITGSDLKLFQVPLPPLLEQKKIAEILSTWDRAIEVTEMLLENATRQKRALMQQLLTGKRRFPEFEGSKWREVKLNEIANIIVSNVDKKSAAGEIPVRLCNYTDVYKNDEITADMEFMSATAKPAQIKRFGLNVGDVIVTKDSETPDDIAIPSYVEKTADDLVCGYHLAIIRPISEVSDGRFLKQLFELPRNRHYFGTRANGATRFGLTIDSLEGAEFKIPSMKEQMQISKVIQNAEMETFKHRETIKTLKIEKKALMQQLLTGKRRVKING